MVEREWWKEAVFYQIYPKSFADADGDGVGDIPGILERIDHLDDLGVDAVWLNPVYESPMADNGYDVADYRSIHPQFGTMDDWERLLEVLHDRDIRLVMDLVVNHTSDEHRWFRRSRAGEEPYADYYYWREDDGDDPPNNWESFFGGSAWTYDDERGEYYLHLFDERQPDLNWRNEAVRESVYEMMSWWFEKGVDGFRMDVVNLLSKPEGLPDGAPNDFQVGVEHYVDGPELETYLSEMHERAVPDDAVTVGETVGVNAHRALEFVGDEGVGLSMLIHFDHVTVDWGATGKWDPAPFDFGVFRAAIDNWQTALADDGWNCIYLENHDQPRSVPRFGDETFRVESATMLGTMLLTLRGTPFVYQGQEIGMTNASFEHPDEIADVEARNFVEEALESGEYDDYEDVRPVVEARSRDNARTPMQWSPDEQAGFTDGEPWIAVQDDHESVNVETQRGDESSVLEHYRTLIELRSEREVLTYGDYEHLLPDHDSAYVYGRSLDDEELVVGCNFAGETVAVELPDVVAGRFADGDPGTLIGNYDDPPTFGPEFDLRPYEAVVYDR